MKITCNTLMSLLLLLSTLPMTLYAVDTIQIPAGGDRLVNPATFLGSDAHAYGKKYGNVELVDVKGMPFSKAVEVTTSTQPEKYYHIGTKYKISSIVDCGCIYNIRRTVYSLTKYNVCAII